MLAVVSDIHANLEALTAVLERIDSLGADEIVCLGDVVGYGPDPEVCLDRVRERCSVVLRGNHDAAVLDEALGFNPAAKKAVDWTRRQVRPRLFAGRRKRLNWAFLRQTRLRHQADGYLFVHGSPLDPVNDYIDERDVDPLGLAPNRKLQSILEMVQGACFVGHTHTPGVIGPEADWNDADDLADGWPLDRAPAVVNVGSVGQPRDRDPRACFVHVQDGVARFHRVCYDVEATVQKMEAIEPLSGHLAQRLRIGC